MPNRLANILVVLSNGHERGDTPKLRFWLSVIVNSYLLGLISAELRGELTEAVVAYCC